MGTETERSPCSPGATKASAYGRPPVWGTAGFWSEVVKGGNGQCLSGRPSSNTTSPALPKVHWTAAFWGFTGTE